MSQNKQRSNKTCILIFLLITNLITLSVALALWISEDYTEKTLIHFGLLKHEEVKKDYWALHAWQSCLENLDLKVDIVFFGDSITQDSHFPNYFPSVSICNLGYSGDTLPGMLERSDSIAAVDPDKIFILAGINDLVGHNSPPQKIHDDYSQLIRNIKMRLPDSEIYLQSILPINNKMYRTSISNNDIIIANREISQVATEHNIEYIDLYSLYIQNDYLPKHLTRDGIHLYDDAYDIWAKTIALYIED